MTLTELFKRIINGKNNVKKLNDDPNSPRYEFLGNEDLVLKQKLDEYRVWLVGDSEELDNFYRQRVYGGGNAKNLPYNRSKYQSFWATSEKEFQFKKVHIDIASSAIFTMVNAIGDVTIEDAEHQDALNDIIKDNNFTVLLNQQARPLTLAEGYGAYKPIFDKSVSKTPIIAYYEAQDVEYMLKSQRVIGIIYKDYYSYQGKNYVLAEIRRVENGDSIIEYKLYRYNKSNEAVEVPLSTIPDLAELPADGLVIPGLNRVLGVASRYFYDPLNKKGGKSVLAGKIDILDDIDMCASIESLTERESAPIRYYPVDLLKKNKNGRPELPEIYDKRYIKKPSVPNADGVEDGKIDIDAPQLDFAKYSQAIQDKICYFLDGFMSPASMGVDVARKDNAMAQREKEKVTMLTRNNVVAAEKDIIKDLMEICLIIQEYMNTGKITLTDYNISVKYNSFASPTFETMAGVLTPMWSAGAISDKMFVDKLYGDDLSEEEKAKEIEEIQKNRQSNDDLMNQMMMGDANNAEGNRTGLPTSENEEEAFDISEK